MDLGSELGEQGFKKIFVIHMHGSPNHNQAIDQAADFFEEVYQGRMINIWNLAFGFSAELRSEEEIQEDGLSIHAGMWETSVLYYLKPEITKTNFKEAKPVTAKSPEDLVTNAKESNWQGYFGSPRLSTSTFGEKYWKGWSSHIISQVDSILDNKYDFSKPTYYEIMSSNPVQQLVNEDAKNHERQLEAKQNEWLKRKGFDQ